MQLDWQWQAFHQVDDCNKHLSAFQLHTNIYFGVGVVMKVRDSFNTFSKWVFPLHYQGDNSYFEEQAHVLTLLYI